MTMGIVEQCCNTIMSGVAVVAGDSSKSQSPYYKYGFKTFETNEGVPPQVRIKKSDFSVVHGISNTPNVSNLPANSSIRASGSNGFREQRLDFIIWGRDEQQCEEEFHNVLAGIQYSGFGLNNSQGITQYNLTHVENGRWVETSDHSAKGEMMRFSYTLKLNIPKPFYATSRVQVLSASLQVSGSTAGTTGSYEGLNSFTIT